MQKRLSRRMVLLLVAAVMMLGGWWHAVDAQDGGETADGDKHLLTLLSADEDTPARFQLLAPGDRPTVEGLQPRLTVSARDALEMPLVYVVIENTGWSRGAIGVVSEALDPEAEYVALEMRNLGMPGYIVREDGQALVFPLTYEADLDGEGTPGFRFDILIGAIRPLRVFRVVEEGGLMLFARENMITDGKHAQERVMVMIDPDPVFGDLLLECHIQARPGPFAVFTPTLEAIAEPTTDAGGDAADASTPAPEPVVTEESPLPEPPPLPSDDG